MSSYVFICDHKGDNWTAKRFSKDEDAEPLEAEASSTYELQKKLSDLAKAQGATGGVQLSFSFVTQTKALCQVIIGGAAASSGGGGGGGGASSGGGGGGGGGAAEEEKKEEKKEEEEEEDEDMGFSLFD
ncbi:60S acidic ribosomal protein P3 [Klebsormidium nitens]|uniref:60S acidic ribosomal protein P3 n=1 Tax=Klebsormidium nitens TaxID=105231 RepID=A0A1Y1IG08_KLENI|nr:60S acidic ribosomal protein P3 [Klebsormidium nitens]|eukprot:GAQ89573.1 60S acidic ribosomal protein P3 [Klebsormidium nitens]